MRTPSFSLLSLAALSALLVGCGGSGSHSPTPSSEVRSVTVSGGASANAQTVATAIAASSAPTTATIGGESVVIPANTAIPAGSVAVLGTPDRLLSLSGTGSFSVGGNATGVSFADGKLGSKIAFPPTGSATTTLAAVPPAGGFTISASGARASARASGSGTLTIHGPLELGVPVLSDGTAGIPSAMGGAVPTDGTSGVPLSLTVTYPTAFASAYSAKLTLIVSGVSITQTRALASDGTVAFSSSHLAIPSTGIDGLRLELVHN